MSIEADRKPEPSSTRHRAAALTDAGTTRSSNQDACCCQNEAPERALVCVADGMGGYEGGELASRMALETLWQAYADGSAALSYAQRLYRAVQQANLAIYDRALLVPELRHMGTTLVAVLIDSDQLHIAHVGDSRAYLIRGGTMRQLTRDHTVAAERMSMGLLSAERARSHPERGTLTRALGRELIAAIDKISIPLQNADVVLACSDGLYNVLDDDEMQDAIDQVTPRAPGEGRSASDACRALVDAANRKGTPDNLSAAVVQVALDPATPRRARWTLRASKLWRR